MWEWDWLNEYIEPDPAPEVVDDGYRPDLGVTADPDTTEYGAYNPEPDNSTPPDEDWGWIWDDYENTYEQDYGYDYSGPDYSQTPIVSDPATNSQSDLLKKLGELLKNALKNASVSGTAGGAPASGSSSSTQHPANGSISPAIGLFAAAAIGAALLVSR